MHAQTDALPLTGMNFARFLKECFFNHHEDHEKPKDWNLKNQ
jgi:hypothetical protein